MATSLTLPFKRFVAQVNTGSPEAKANYKALAQRNALALESCEWEESADDVEASLVDHDFYKTFNEPRYDAFLMTGAYDSTRNTEIAYAGMVAYRFKLPDAYLSGNATLVSAAIQLNRDRFLLPGLRVSAVASNDTAPSTSWAVVRGEAEGCIKLSAQLPNSANRITAAEPATAAVEVDLEGIDDPTKPTYLWVYLTVEDYTATWEWYSSTQHRLYAIEGSGMVVGSASSVTFSADVAPDGEAVVSGFPVAHGGILPVVPTGAVYRRTLELRTDANPIVEESDGVQIPIRPAPGTDAAAALSRLYADFYSGRGAVAEGNYTQPTGASFSVSRTSVSAPTPDSDTPKPTDILRIETALLLVPFVFPANRMATNIVLDFAALDCAPKSRFNVFLALDKYMLSLEETATKNPGLYDGRDAPFRLIGTIDSGTTATLSVADIVTSANRVGTLIITGWLPPEGFNLTTGGTVSTGNLMPNVTII